MKTTLPFLTVLAAASAVLLSGCGRTDVKAAASGAEATAAAPGANAIRITADDTMRFNVTTIEAKAGEPLQIVFTNTGRMPKQAMGHNWVLLKPCSEADFNAFGMAAAGAAPTFIPAARADQVIVHSKMLGPGESDTIAFTAPSEPGEYPFTCTFPGHFSLMRGKLIVR
jgi:azurin